MPWIPIYIVSIAQSICSSIIIYQSLAHFFEPSFCFLQYATFPTLLGWNFCDLLIHWYPFHCNALIYEPIEVHFAERNVILLLILLMVAWNVFGSNHQGIDFLLVDILFFTLFCCFYILADPLFPSLSHPPSSWISLYSITLWRIFAFQSWI